MPLCFCVWDDVLKHSCSQALTGISSVFSISFVVFLRAFLRLCSSIDKIHQTVEGGIEDPIGLKRSDSVGSTEAVVGLEEAHVAESVA